ncbi:hypothetical protein KJ599_02465, partial [bacterium]|nr:hypothetical protein [bacterium]
MNAEKGIRITPLRIAERFEKERKNLSSQFRYGGFKTAKCYIKANNEEEAKKIANWLEMIYSFAQSRSVYFSEWYSYKKGGKYISSEPKQIEPIENRFSELVSGTRIGRISFKKDISLFVNTALDTLKKSEQQKQDEIMIIIYAYMISKSQMVNELKFLIGWIALEKLANEKYNSCIYTNRGLNKTEIKKLKKFVKCSLKLYYYHNFIL